MKMNCTIGMIIALTQRIETQQKPRLRLAQLCPKCGFDLTSIKYSCTGIYICPVCAKRSFKKELKEYGCVNNSRVISYPEPY